MRPTPVGVRRALLFLLTVAVAWVGHPGLVATPQTAASAVGADAVDPSAVDPNAVDRNAAAPRVAVIELHNGTGERLARFDSASEELLRDAVIATGCCRVLTRGELSSRLLAQPIRLHSIYGNAEMAADLGAALDVEYVITGQAFDYVQTGDEHQLDLRLTAVDVGRRDIVFQTTLQGRLSSAAAHSQHRPLLRQLFAGLGPSLAESLTRPAEAAPPEHAGRTARAGERTGQRTRRKPRATEPAPRQAPPPTIVVAAPPGRPRDVHTVDAPSGFRIPDDADSAPPMAAWPQQFLGPALQGLSPEDRREALAAMGLDASALPPQAMPIPPRPTSGAASVAAAEAADPLRDAWRLIEVGRTISARPVLETALRDALRRSDRRREARARDGLCEIGKRHGIYRLAPALAHGWLALDIHQQLGDTAAESRARRRLATIHTHLGQGEVALQHLDAARALGAAGDDPALTEGTLLEAQGRARLAMGTLEPARLDLQRAAAHWRQHGLRVRQARVLTELAALEASLGRLQKADDYLTQVAELYGAPSADFDLEALLQRINAVKPSQTWAELNLNAMGYQAAAAQNYDAQRQQPSWDTRFDAVIRKAYREVMKDSPADADVLLQHRRYFEGYIEHMMPANMDRFAETLGGVPDEALCPPFLRSVVLAQRARIYQQIGRFTRAEELRQRAWDAWTDTSRRLATVVISATMGEVPFGTAGPAPVEVFLGIPPQAREVGALPPPLVFTGSRCGSGRNFQLWQASAWALAGQHQRAELAYRGAQGTTPHTQAEALIGLAEAVEAQGKLDEALELFEQAVSLGDLLLDGVRVEPIAYAARLTTAHESMVRLLAQRGDGVGAFAAAERARAHVLRRQLIHRRSLDGDASARQVQDLKGVRVQIARLQELLHFEAISSLNLEVPRTGPSQLAQRLHPLQQKQAELQARLHAEHPEVAALLAPRALELAAVQRDVPAAGSSLLVYFVLPDETLAWVIDRDATHFERLAIGRRRLEDLVTLMVDGTSSELPFEAPASALYDALVRPLDPWLRHDHVQVVPHGMLHYVPLAALWDRAEQRFWIAHKALSIAPSVTALRVLGRDRPVFGGRALVLGNPDASLGAAQREAAAVAALFGTKAHLRDDASKQLFLERAALSDIVHVAAHGIFDAADPMASRLQLAPAGQAGELTAADIFGLDLASTHLVVLSACRTGIGELSRGDDIVGLSRAFLAAGASSVVTTLWNVDDDATSDLMQSFYGHLRRPGITLAAALQAAQLEMLQDPEHSAPFFWAGVRLSGAAHRWP